MLLADPAKIPFSTASLKKRRTQSEHNFDSSITDVAEGPIPLKKSEVKVKRKPAQIASISEIDYRWPRNSIYNDLRRSGAARWGPSRPSPEIAPV